MRSKSGLTSSDITGPEASMPTAKEVRVESTVVYYSIDAYNTVHTFKNVDL